MCIGTDIEYEYRHRYRKACYPNPLLHLNGFRQGHGCNLSEPTSRTNAATQDLTSDLHTHLQKHNTLRHKRSTSPTRLCIPAPLHVPRVPPIWVPWLLLDSLQDMIRCGACSFHATRLPSCEASDLDTDTSQGLRPQAASRRPAEVLYPEKSPRVLRASMTHAQNLLR